MGGRVKKSSKGGRSSTRGSKVKKPALLVVLSSPENYTVQVALSNLRSGYVTDFSLVLTGTMLATVPLLVVFVILGKQIIGGIMQGALKG